MNNHDGQRRHREELIQTHASRGYKKDETAWLKIIVVPVEVDIWGGHMWWVYNQQITGMVSIYTLCHLLEEMKRESFAQLRARCAYISLLNDKNNGKFLDSMVTESGTSSSSSHPLLIPETVHYSACRLYTDNKMQTLLIFWRVHSFMVTVFVFETWFFQISDIMHLCFQFCHNFSEFDAWEVESYGYKHAQLATKLRILKVNYCQ